VGGAVHGGKVGGGDGGRAAQGGCPFLGLGTVDCFAVGGVGFAADVVGNAGLGEQIALVGGIDEHFGAIAAAVFHDDFAQRGAVLDDAAAITAEALVGEDAQVGGGDHFGKHALCGGGLEGPFGVLVGVGAGLAVVLIFFRFLPFPVGGLAVVGADALIELAGNAADDVFVADVRLAKSAGGETADVVRWLEHDDGAVFPLGLDAGDDTGGCAAEDDDVITLHR
jgi:hypothetical protein